MNDPSPQLVFHSDRLVFRPYALTDIDLAISVFTDPEVMKYTGGPKSEASIREESQKWTQRGGNGCIGIWCVSDRESGEKLGTGALLPMPIETSETDFRQMMPDRFPEADIEIGYFLKRTAWGQGLATEIGRRLVAFAFEESPLTEIVVFPSRR